MVIRWPASLARATDGSSEPIEGVGLAIWIVNGSDRRISAVEDGFATTMSAGPVGTLVGMIASSCVSLIARVVAARGPTKTVEPNPKFSPVTRIVLPAVASGGVTPVIDGLRAVTSISNGSDVTLPGLTAITGWRPCG